ncbi:MAG: phosphodiesterase [Candidatus Geothermincolia bacterium]
MKIGMVSDTHGDVDAWEKAWRLLADCDLILHAGDHLYHGAFNPILASYDPLKLAGMMNASPVPMVHARGNCDSEVDAVALSDPLLSPYVFLVLEGTRILLTHGDRYEEDELARMGSRFGCRLVVRGHTHLRGVVRHGSLSLVNPGSISLPKGDGIPSLAILTGDTVTLRSLPGGEVLEESVLV